MTRWLVKRYIGDVVSPDPVLQLPDAAQCNDRVPITIWPHVIDQIHNAVFEPTGVEVIDQMHDQRRSVVRRRNRRW